MPTLPPPPPLLLPQIETLARRDPGAAARQLADALVGLSHYLDTLRQEIERGKVAVVATADLPAAAAAQDGKLVIEDGGAGNRNLVLYGGGERFRVDGGPNV